MTTASLNSRQARKQQDAAQKRTSIFAGRDGTAKTIHVGGLTPDDIERELTPLLSQ